jgi:hypothetical protein
MTVKELYVQAGQSGDYHLRRAIEKAALWGGVLWEEDAEVFWDWYVHGSRTEKEEAS